MPHRNPRKATFTFLKKIHSFDQVQILTLIHQSKSQLRPLLNVLIRLTHVLDDDQLFLNINTDQENNLRLLRQVMLASVADSDDSTHYSEALWRLNMGWCDGIDHFRLTLSRVVAILCGPYSISSETARIIFHRKATHKSFDQLDVLLETLQEFSPVLDHDYWTWFAPLIGYTHPFLSKLNTILKKEEDLERLLYSYEYLNACESQLQSAIEFYAYPAFTEWTKSGLTNRWLLPTFKAELRADDINELYLLSRMDSPKLNSFYIHHPWFTYIMPSLLKKALYKIPPIKRAQLAGLIKYSANHQFVEVWEPIFESYNSQNIESLIALAWRKNSNSFSYDVFHRIILHKLKNKSSLLAFGTLYLERVDVQITFLNESDDHALSAELLSKLLQHNLFLLAVNSSQDASTQSFIKELKSRTYRALESLLHCPVLSIEQFTTAFHANLYYQCPQIFNLVLAHPDASIHLIHCLTLIKELHDDSRFNSSKRGKFIKILLPYLLRYTPELAHQCLDTLCGHPRVPYDLMVSLFDRDDPGYPFSLSNLLSRSIEAKQSLSLYIALQHGALLSSQDRTSITIIALKGLYKLASIDRYFKEKNSSLLISLCQHRIQEEFDCALQHHQYPIAALFWQLGARIDSEDVHHQSFFDRNAHGSAVALMMNAPLKVTDILASGLLNKSRILMLTQSVLSQNSIPRDGYNRYAASPTTVAVPLSPMAL